MSQAGLSTASSGATQSQAEYMIYAYSCYEPAKTGHNRWQLVSTMQDFPQAMVKAEELYKSHLYEKVEVKTKIFDQKRSAYTSSTVRVYQTKESPNFLVLVSCALIMFAFAGYVLWL